MEAHREARTKAEVVMARGQRSDPAKLKREREAITRDLEKRTPIKRPNVVQRVVGAVSERISARKRRRIGYGGVPRVRGAMVVGERKPRSEA